MQKQQNINPVDNSLIDSILETVSPYLPGHPETKQMVVDLRQYFDTFMEHSPQAVAVFAAVITLIHAEGFTPERVNNYLTITEMELAKCPAEQVKAKKTELDLP